MTRGEPQDENDQNDENDYVGLHPRHGRSLAPSTAASGDIPEHWRSPRLRRLRCHRVRKPGAQPRSERLVPAPRSGGRPEAHPHFLDVG